MSAYNKGCVDGCVSAQKREGSAMGKTIDFQQQKDLRVWRTVMEALHAIQNLSLIHI